MSLSTLLQKSSGFIALLLTAFVAYQLALLTWFFVPSENSGSQWLAPKVSSSQTENRLDTSGLQDQHLFGKTVKKAPAVKKVVAVSDAPKTKLNVTLVGVVAASSPAYSSAIIAYKGKQESYFIGSKITGTKATVSDIHSDRVLLDVDGTLQTLMLDGVEKLDKQQQRHELKGKEEVSKNKVAINHELKTVKLDRQALLKDPGKLTDYIKISPVRESGEIKGYRIKPGKDRTLFDQAGLKNGDLAIELNGIDLTDMQQAFGLMKELPTMTDVSLTVERGEQLHELYFSIPQ